MFINNINTTYCFYDYKELLKIDKEYNFEAYVVGSDQVWLPSFFPWSFLNFVTRDNVKRIAYAASFGHATWQYDDEQTKKLLNWLKNLMQYRFEKIVVLLFVKIILK